MSENKYWSRFRFKRLLNNFEITFRYLRKGFWLEYSKNNIFKLLYDLMFEIIILVGFIPYSFVSLLFCLFAGGFLKTYQEMDEEKHKELIGDGITKKVTKNCR